MATIRCTNPNCEQMIEAPKGAQQVICPFCNTWHFISSEETGDSGQDANDAGGYMPPSPIQDLTPKQTGLPAYEPYSPSSELSAKQAGAPATDSLEKAGGSQIGFLVTREGKKYPLRAGRNVIGRKGCDVNIDDDTVSRRHCVIEVASAANGKWEFTIYDIGHLEGSPSTNGVLLSERSLRLENYERISITNGTAIQLGETELMLYCPAK